MTADEFLPQLVLMIFAAAFVTIIVVAYTKLWNLLEINTSETATRNILIRICLPAVVWVLAAIISFTSLYVYNNSWIYASIGVFLIAFPVLDRRINSIEYFARCAVLFLIWGAYHLSNLFSVQNVLTMFGLFVLLVAIRTWMSDIKYRLSFCLGAGLYVSLGFWLTFPNVKLNSSFIWSNIIVYMLMTLLTCVYWIIEYRHRLSMSDDRQTDLTPTDLYASYERDISSLFNMSKQGHKPMTLAIVDIDKFTSINERFGHLGANVILSEFETLLQTVLQQYATVYHLFRSGGEEFNIIFMNASTVDTAPILLDCWDTIRTHTFDYNYKTLSMTVSIGATQVQTVDETIDDAYGRANKSLTRSKLGRDAITVEGVAQHAKEATNWFPTYRYFVQPIVDASKPDHPLLLNEMLLREFDRNQWLLPDNFEIPVTTQISLVKQVLNHNDCTGVNINLTSQQFSDSQIAQDLARFKRHEPRISEFVIEVMDAPSLNIIKKISALYHESGIKVYLDDVGSDNSYELILNMFPFIDGLKFAIQNLRKTNDPDQLLERIGFWHDIAEKNNLEFVLEGVETEDESKYSVDKYGIYRQQGYYFAKPVLPEQELIN